MLVTRIIKKKWNPRYKKFYEDGGYTYTKMGDEFEVKVEDMQNGSRENVDVECDGCTKLLHVVWTDYRGHVREDGKYYCVKCANNLFGKFKSNKTKLGKSKSFYQWCYDNLPKEDADKILARWDYKLNGVSPDDVTFGSDKKYWFKCGDYESHIPEQKSINWFTHGHKGSVECNQCNSISITNLPLVSYIVNKKDIYEYSQGSGKKILMRCPDCGYEKLMIPNTFIRSGFSCPRCSDGVSYPEKFLFSMMEQLDIYFGTQLSKLTFFWCGDYRYDFYISTINCIIEAHGSQHYVETGRGMTLNEIQENDIVKEHLARENNVIDYIILDCRKSKIKWIKNSIIISKLPQLLNFKVEDINWLKCHEYACSSMVKRTCDLWNEDNTVPELSNMLKLNTITIVKYLKQGSKIGWCNYNHIEETKKNKKEGHEKSYKQVVCLTTSEIFNSIKEASIKFNLSNGGSIIQCCRNKINSAGKHPETGKKLKWMYYKDFVTKTDGEIKLILDNVQEKTRTSDIKIICLTTGQIYNSIAEAGIYYGIPSNGIVKCCKGKQAHAGRHLETGKYLTWMYYSEYILKTEDQISDMIKNENNLCRFKIICLTTNIVFNSHTEAGLEYNIGKYFITSCCKGKEKSAGKHPITKEPLKWMYYEEYIKNENNSHELLKI